MNFPLRSFSAVQYFVVGCILLGTAGCSREEVHRQGFERLAFDFGAAIVHDSVSRTEVQEKVVRQVIARGDLARAGDWIEQVDGWRRASLLMALAEGWHRKGDIPKRDACVQEALRLIEANPKWQKSFLLPAMRRCIALWQDPVLSARLPAAGQLAPREQKEVDALGDLQRAEYGPETRSASEILAVDDLGLIDHKLAKVRSLLRLVERAVQEGKNEEASRMVAELDGYLKSQVPTAELMLRSAAAHRLLESKQRDLAVLFVGRLEELALRDMTNPVSRASVEAGLGVLQARMGRAVAAETRASAAERLALEDPHFLPFERNRVLLTVAEARLVAGHPEAGWETVSRALARVESLGNLRSSCEMAAEIALFLAEQPSEGAAALRSRLQHLLVVMKKTAATREYRRE